MKNFSIYFVGNAVTKMFHREALGKTLNKSVRFWLRPDTLVQELAKKVVDEPSYTTAVSACVNQRAIEAFEEEFEQ